MNRNRATGGGTEAPRRSVRRRKKNKIGLICTSAVVAGAVLTGCLLMGAGKRADAAAADPQPTDTLVVERPSSSSGSPSSSQVTPDGAEELPAEVEDAMLTLKTGPMMTLVNPWNPLPENYTLTLKQMSNGHSVDERCYPDLQQMMDDCRAAGLSPLICSSYRTQEKQTSLFNNQVNKYLGLGYSEEAARQKAGTIVAVPGTSEHQLGLAVDIVSVGNQNLDESQEDTPTQKWLMENSWKYGFILRYPNEKSEVTGIIYEPWHYRYVGKAVAKDMVEKGVCLEEYLAPIE